MLRKKIQERNASHPDRQDRKQGELLPGSGEGIQILYGLNVEHMLAVRNLEIKKGEKFVKDTIQPEKIVRVRGKDGIEISQRALDYEHCSTQNKP